MNILIYTLKSIAFALTEPYLVLLLAILAIMLYRKNKKTAIMQKMIIGEKIDSPFELTISQIVIGIFAGAIASSIMSYLGIVFDENSAVDLIFLISVIFMFFNPRFICFSYSGAALGFTSLVLSIIAKDFNMPQLNFLKIDVVALMTMVAVLHFIEGILVMIDGKTGSIPVFTNREDKIVGGFAFQRYWALPIAIFFMLNNPQTLDVSWQVPMPTWWPVIKTSIPLNVLKTAVVALIPFYGIIGFNSVTFTRSKKEKTLTSGVLIIAYSLLILVLAQLASLNIFLKFVVVIVAPIAHESIIILERYLEMKRNPKYISGEDGIMVLAVAPNSPASEMGIKCGDLLVEVNSQKIETEEKIADAIRETSNFIWFKVRKVAGNFEQVSYNNMNSSKRLGIVFVPKGVPKDSMVVKMDNTKFSDILEKIKNKDEGEDE